MENKQKLQETLNHAQGVRARLDRALQSKNTKVVLDELLRLAHVVEMIARINLNGSAVQSKPIEEMDPDELFNLALEKETSGTAGRQAQQVEQRLIVRIPPRQFHGPKHHRGYKNHITPAELSRVAGISYNRVIDDVKQGILKTEVVKSGTRAYYYSTLDDAQAYVDENPSIRRGF